MRSLEIHSKNLRDTKRAAEILLEKISQNGGNLTQSSPGATVAGLYGDLGAGKTAFTQFFGELLGVQEKIASPTFVLEKIYKIKDSRGDGQKIPAENFSHLIHIDAYRIESEKEMENLGWKDIVENPKNIILIEWPEKIAGLMPENHIRIYFEHFGGGENENSRKITFKNVAK